MLYRVLAPVRNVIEILEVVLILRDKAGTVLGGRENGSLLCELLIEIANVFWMFLSKEIQ